VRILKTALVIILSLLAAFALTIALTITLLESEYPADPVILITTSFVGLCLLFSSLYFKREKIRQAAWALLGFSFVGLFVLGT
jgi:heme O synthase-like polyprenyltransferase